MSITGNTLSRNNWGDEEAPNTSGVNVFANSAPGAANYNTTISGNTMTKQFYGVWASLNPLNPQSVAPTVSTNNNITVTKGGSAAYTTVTP